MDHPAVQLACVIEERPETPTGPASAVTISPCHGGHWSPVAGPHRSSSVWAIGRGRPGTGRVHPSVQSGGGEQVGDQCRHGAPDRVTEASPVAAGDGRSGAAGSRPLPAPVIGVAAVHGVGRKARAVHRHTGRNSAPSRSSSISSNAGGLADSVSVGWEPAADPVASVMSLAARPSRQRPHATRTGPAPGRQ